jgi:hypothetical protein
LSLEELIDKRAECEESGQEFIFETEECWFKIKTRKSEELRESMLSTLTNVYAEKAEDKQLFLIYSNMSLTRYFVEIWSKIHGIIDGSIWTKDSDWLVKYLGKTCELQCTNKWTSNCFAK